MKTITITTDFIKLQDMLKLGNLTASGGEAKLLIQDGQVLVDGEPCTQRGRKIRPGNIITFNKQNFCVIYADK